MTPRVRALLVCACLWGAVLGLSVCGGQPAFADPPPAPPIKFETEREARYWSALTQCSQELEVSKRRLLGEVRKVQTASVTCTLSCPVIPACPPSPACEASCLLPSIGGAAGAGLLCAGLWALQARQPSIVIAK